MNPQGNQNTYTVNNPAVPNSAGIRGNNVQAQSYSFGVPQDGQVFRATGNQGSTLYMRKGNSIQGLNLLDPNFVGSGFADAGGQMAAALQTMRARGLDYNSLPEYSMGDLQQQASNIGLNFGSVSTAAPNAYFPGGSPTTSDAVNQFIQANQNFSNATKQGAEAQNQQQNNQLDTSKQNANASARGQSQQFQPQNTQPATQNISQALAANGLPSDYQSRAHMASQVGISGYSGTQQQNALILQGLQSGSISWGSLNLTPTSMTSTPGGLSSSGKASPVFSIGAPAGSQPQSTGITEDYVNTKSQAFFTWLEGGSSNSSNPFDKTKS